MKIITLVTCMLLFSTYASAEVLSSCHANCFEKKAKCNAENSHTFNHCNEELFVCRASCKSGKQAGTYDRTLPFKVTFQPIVEF